jgi:hypothetical protein
MDNMMQGDHSEDTNRDGRMKLKRILKKYDL